MSTDGTGRDGVGTARSPRSLRAIVERYDDAPDQCTIYPSGTDDHERMATWITATDPGFVDLQDVR